MEIVIRRATKADIPALMKLNIAQNDYHAALDPAFLRRGRDLKKNRMREYFKKEIPRRNGRVFVAQTGSRLVGFVMCEIQKMSPVIKQRQIGYVRTLYVDGRARGMGVGIKLVEAVRAWVKSRGMKRIELGVLSNNKKGLGFWQHQGFKERMKRMWRPV